MFAMISMRLWGDKIKLVQGDGIRDTNGEDVDPRIPR